LQAHAAGSQYEALAQTFEPLETADDDVAGVAAAADDVAGVAAAAEVVAAFVVELVVDVVDFVVDFAATADVVDALVAADVFAAGACPDCRLPLLSQ